MHNYKFTYKNSSAVVHINSMSTNYQINLYFKTEDKDKFDRSIRDILEENCFKDQKIDQKSHIWYKRKSIDMILSSGADPYSNIVHDTELLLVPSDEPDICQDNMPLLCDMEYMLGQTQDSKDYPVYVSSSNKDLNIKEKIILINSAVKELCSKVIKKFPHIYSSTKYTENASDRVLGISPVSKRSYDRNLEEIRLDIEDFQKISNNH